MLVPQVPRCRRNGEGLPEGTHPAAFRGRYRGVTCVGDRAAKKATCWWKKSPTRCRASCNSALDNIVGGPVPQAAHHAAERVWQQGQRLARMRRFVQTENAECAGSRVWVKGPPLLRPSSPSPPTSLVGCVPLCREQGGQQHMLQTFAGSAMSCML